MLCINHFAEYHDYDKIVFCKTDYIVSELDAISQQNKKIILITGNSDYPITDNIAKLLPNNVIKWYAENAISNHEKIIPIPIGIENEFECKRPGHGIAFADRYKEKKTIINELKKTNKEPTKFIYANFNISTNKQHRTKIKEYVKNISYITWKDPVLSYSMLYNEIFDHKIVLCPIGNGIDTHRLWETLYCNRIPLTIKTGKYKIYELYEKLPIIIIDDIDQIKDYDYIKQQYEIITNRFYDLSLLSLDYWTNHINQDFNLNEKDIHRSRGE